MKTIAENPTPSLSTDRHSMLRRIGRNFSIVLVGNIAGALFALLTLSLNARALGVTGLGILALITSTAALLGRICSFQSWVPLIKLGSEALEVGDRHRLGTLISVALLFDAVAAIVAAVAATFVILLAGERVGIPEEYVGLAAIYMATLATGISGSAIGILRLFNRFGILATVQTAGPALALVAATALFLLDANLGTYILVFAGVAVLANVVTTFCGLGMAIRADIGFGWTPRAAWRSVGRQFWSFSWATSLYGSVQVIRQQVPVLVLGALVGPAAVGLYYAAERIAAFLLMVMWPVSQALYPEAARLAANHRHQDLQWLAARAGAYCGLAGVAGLFAAVLFGSLILRWIGGPPYSEAYLALIILLAGHCLAMAGVGFNSAVIVTSGPIKILKASFVALLSIGLVIPFTIEGYGAAGTATTQLVFDGVWLAILAWEFKRSLPVHRRTFSENQARIASRPEELAPGRKRLLF